MRSKDQFDLFNNEILLKEKRMKEKMEGKVMSKEYKNITEVRGATYFTGVEVKNTPTKGLDTLFVVGLQPVDDIIQMALQRNIKSIYFGANHSFDLSDPEQWDNWLPWVKMIKGVLADPALFWCSLDFDLSYQESFLETGLAEHNRMIPMVSVKIPYIEQLGYNAVIKIDDIDFNRTNPGVWCHPLSNLMSKETFTHWQEYNDDELLKGEHGKFR